MMVHTTVVTRRPDVDIQADIERLLLTYPPLTKDRHSIQVQVQDGAVTVTGHVQTPNTRRYFLNLIPTVEGVTSVDATRLFDDESIRLEVGRLLPTGVRVGRFQYGNVVLTGRLPDDVNADDLLEQVRQVPGVRRIITDFR
ncbi:MAG: BON domain-containing protein [Chloroflexi bacterium]|nr:BON domain-containing protein [Chloroflexota bacterium]